MALLERDGALAALTAALEGGGRVVIVTGEPGIGKTALVAEFVAQVEDQARVLLGTCDDLSVPRPLGPLRDLVGDVSRELAHAVTASGGTGVARIHELLLDELAPRPGEPAVLVLEDVHWADEATLDVITVIGRRIAALGTLLVLTYRDGEVPAAHPLRAAIGAIRPDVTTYVALEPLSRDAIATLASDGVDAEAVHTVTGGNPFFVTELLAGADGDVTELPPSVANAVLGRMARLGDDERRLVELVSAVPNRVASDLLDVVMPNWPEAAEALERRALIEVGPRHVRFRHELGRHAVRSSIPIAARRRLHRQILEALLATEADPADIVHHAQAAGIDRVVAEHAPVAARHARDLASNREAFEHFRLAADVSGHLTMAGRAALTEELAWAAYAAGHVDQALAAIDRAAALWDELGDVEAVGRSAQARARLHWFAGNGDAARAAAEEAVAILEPHGESAVLARSYGAVAQLAMLSDDVDSALTWGERAATLAERVGDAAAHVNAAITLGSADLQRDPYDERRILLGHDLAVAAGDHHEVTRSLGNHAYTVVLRLEPERARELYQRALDYSRRYEVHSLGPYAEIMLAWLQLRQGDWQAADAVAAWLDAGDPGSITAQQAHLILTERAVRRGDDDAARRLEVLTAAARRTGETQRLVPTLELAVEHALLTGHEPPTEELAALIASGGGDRFALRIAALAGLAGLPATAPKDAQPVAYAAMARREWNVAAEAFGAIGWRYDRALTFSFLDEEEALAESLAVARDLGAEPLARRVALRMRELGLGVPKAPRRTTRSNPAGLTARQLEVLELLADGRTNSEIAEQLVLSTRTAEHHVAAVLSKLGATSRRDVARRAAELGIA